MLTKIFPFLEWFKGYTIGKLQIDAIAGLTVALVLIPQSMAYAQLAGMPAYYGLYASFLPPMLAALFGSSRQLATGPVAVVSLMTSASLEPLATAGSESFVAYAILLALIVGLFQFSLGLLRLGVVVNFISHPVVNGFTNAAAIIIASSQFNKMFGVSVDKAEHHYETIIRVVKAALQFTHWPTLLMGLLAFAIMYILKRTAPRIPNVLVAVVVTTSISWLIGFEHNQQVALSAIRSDNALTLVRQFNEATAAIAPLAEERSAVGKKLEAVKKTHEHIAVLKLEHETNLLTARMEELKSAAAVAREQLRRLKLVRVGDDPSAPGQFFLQGEAVGQKNDGRTWRFRIGNTVLKEDKLPLTGGGAVVGVVPSGLPTPGLPKIDVGVMMYLLPYAVIISLLGFMEAVSIAKAMAAKTGQRLDANQELLGQGIANALGALTQSFPTSGSFSRSAVNLQAGAVSGFSSVFTSITVVIVLLFFTPLLYHLPQSVLAAVIMMAVIGLINVSGFVHAWKAQWYDGAISVISFIATLAFAPHLDKGIMIGVGLSLLVFLYKSMRPTIASLSRTLDKSMGDAAIHGLKECQYMAVVRFDGPLFYANASYLEERVGQIRLERKHLRHVVLVCNGISDMDASGEEALSFLVDRLRSAGIEISFSGINEAVMAVLRRTHLLEKIGEENIFPTREQAVCAMHGKAHRGVEEPDCPLFSVCRLA